MACGSSAGRGVEVHQERAFRDGGGCSRRLNLWEFHGRGGGEAGVCGEAHLVTISPGGRPHED